MKKLKLLLAFSLVFMAGCEHKIQDSSKEAQVAFPQKTVSELFSDEELMKTAELLYPEMYRTWFSFISSNRYYDNQKFGDKYIYKIEREDIQSIEDIRKDYYENFSKRYDFPFDNDPYKNVYTEKEDGLYAKFTWNSPSDKVYYPGKINEIKDDLVIYEIYMEDEKSNVYDTSQTFSLVYSQDEWIYGTFFIQKEKLVELECKFPTGKYTALNDTDTYKFVGSKDKVTHIDKDRTIQIKTVKRHYLDGVHPSYWGQCKNGSWICLSDSKGTYLQIEK